MDYSVGCGEGGPVIRGSDSLLELGYDFGDGLLKTIGAGTGTDATVVQVMAGEVVSGRAVEKVMVRIRGWGRTRLGAGHLTSPRLLAAASRGTISLLPEGAKAPWHYVVLLGTGPCSICVQECRIPLARSQLAVYRAECALKIDFGASGDPGVILDGLLW